MRLEPDRMVGALRELVEQESPSRDKAALDRLASWLESRLRDAGGRVERVSNAQGGDHLIARFFEERPGAPALIAGHFDTVWPLGTLDSMPYRLEDGRAHGPGIFDMKAGLVIAEFALRSLRYEGTPPPCPVTFLLTSDEEIGSPTGRPVVERLSLESAYALIPEPPLPGGGAKTSRKGVGRFTIEVEGVAAHAGLEPEKGRSAVVELSHQVLALLPLNDAASGTSVTVGTIRGGTTPNVVPALATAELDVRATTVAEAMRVEAAIRGLQPRTEGTSLRIEGGFNRPPMERTAAIANLYEQARAIAAGLAIELAEGSAGGGSDGNFTTALGLPTLDGLGVPGDGAHAPHEHILIDELPRRAGLLAALLMYLQAPERTREVLS